MPPIRRSLEISLEGKIQLATFDFEYGRLSNIREATRIHDIPRLAKRSIG
jgi:hypothetical protein